MNKCYLCLAKLTTNTELFCSECTNLLPFISSACSGCATPTQIPLTSCGICSKNKFQFDSAHSVFEYSYPINSIIKRFKDNKLHNPEILHIWLFSCFYHQYHQMPDLEFDAIAAIPSSFSKTFTRNHMPAATLAQQLSRRTKIPIINDLISKKFGHHSQKKKSKENRHQSSIFHLHQEKLQPYQPSPNILLIDDIITTGASLNQAAKLLKGAGCEQVHCLTLAKTPLHHS